MGNQKRKIFVVSNNNKIKGECDLYSQMFQEGLDCLHIRKYGYPRSKIVSIIESIPSEFHKQIVLHDHYDIAREMNLGGIHLIRDKRKNIFFKVFQLPQYLKIPGFHISTSYHSTNKILEAPDFYTYFFLNSIFGSVLEGGKHSYKDPDKLKALLKNCSKEIVPLGGIDMINIDLIKEMGFTSMGLHGAIWGFTNPLERFCILRDAFLS